MSKHSILDLTRTLSVNGYSEKAVETVKEVITEILSSGSFFVAGKHFSAAGVKPLFKLNRKSADIYLITAKNFNVIRVHADDHVMFYNPRSNPDGKTCCIANQRELALPFNQKQAAVPYEPGFMF